MLTSDSSIAMLRFWVIDFHPRMLWQNTQEKQLKGRKICPAPVATDYNPSYLGAEIR
jgi:hypothetical protein